MYTDEIQLLVNTSGSEDFGFSFTRNSWIQDFGSGAAQGDSTRIPDLGIQRWGPSGSASGLRRYTRKKMNFMRRIH